MDALKSMFKKVKSISKHGLKPYQEGKKNLELELPEIEEEAKRRAEICKACPLFEDEPIEDLKIKDTRIPALDSKICGDCGCSSPYLLRQNTKLCRNW